MALKIAVLGVTGRMGKAIVSALTPDRGIALVGGTASVSSSAIGSEIAPGVKVVSAVNVAIANAQVAIDFTLPGATAANIAACTAAKCPLVIGTTGLSSETSAAIAMASQIIPILVAPNMSIGVNLLLGLVQSAAAALNDSYDIEVFEAHHRNKKDAPSGTALALGRAAADGRQVGFESVAEYGRHGETGPRRKGVIGFSVLRAGDIVGDHTVTFAGVGERVELTHRAHDRSGFVAGALAAAGWIAQQPPGQYKMADVLGIAS
jgi:4-hydroxy-tetrahydrodipicolinate reductase